LKKSCLFEKGSLLKLQQRTSHSEGYNESCAKAPAAEKGYWMTGSSGKRHNPSCRYYGIVLRADRAARMMESMQNLWRLIVLIFIVSAAYGEQLRLVTWNLEMVSKWVFPWGCISGN